MKLTNHLYLVSFGNSRQYRLLTEEPVATTRNHPHPALENIESRIRNFLSRKFPGEPLAYFFTPKVEEISWSHREEYSDYPLLDDNALKEIEKVLVTGVEDMESDKELNNDPETNFAAPEY